MDARYRRKPLIVGRGVLRIEDFCRHTGLDQDAVEPLLRTGRIPGGLWRDNGDLMGLFEDLLPTPEHLRALGLTVNDTYKPEDLASYTDDGP